MENPVPDMPFYGSKVVKGISLSEIASWLDERATFVGQWGLKPSRDHSKSLETLIEQEGRPRLRYWLEQIQKNNLNEFGVAYGYFPAYSEGNKISILDESRSSVLCEMEFPRQTKGEQLCLSDYVKPKSSNVMDFVAFHMVTMGNAVSQYANKLFSEDRYRDYLEIHGLSVQLTEALAEMWHARIRRELKIDGNDALDLQSILKQDYQGERYSFGYPACPDLSLQVPLMNLLHPERIGIELSEEFQLHPEQSTSAIIFHHPEARYFNAK
jgi:5-methyltetrahydrofolate--homocysteine methyltransferase